MTYTIAECTVNKLLMMDRGTLRNMQSFISEKICEISASIWFYYKEVLPGVWYVFCVILYTDISWIYLLEFAVCDSSYAGAACLYPGLMPDDIPYL